MPREETVDSTKIAIITGGSRGLGRSTVVSLAKRGVDSIFTYNSNRAEADKVIGLVGDKCVPRTSISSRTTITCAASIVCSPPIMQLSFAISLA
jgi:NAD(P)-dependent dehydrogenase (short-subunit alcohol dehydrogenase family)